MGQARARVAAGAVGLALLVVAQPLFASCPSAARGPLSEAGARASGQWLYEAQLRDAHRARRWRYVWSGVNGTLAVASFAAMPFATRDQRVELAVGGAYSTVAAVFTWFVPLEVEQGLDRRTNGANLCDGLRVEEESAASAAADDAARLTLPVPLLHVGAGARYPAIV